MDKRRRKPKTRRFPTEWKSFPYWYLLLMLVLLWVWNGAFMQFSVRTLPYSEFKDYLRKGEVTECAVKENAVDGKIVPKPGTEAPKPDAPKGGKAADNTKPFFFRTIRVEDPKLVEELERANVTFTGVRPGLLGQVLLSFALPIAFMIMLWSFLSRRLGRPGESILGFGKTRARLAVDTDTKVSFSDVAGCDEAKYELQE